MRVWKSTYRRSSLKSKVPTSSACLQLSPDHYRMVIILCYKSISPRYQISRNGRNARKMAVWYTHGRREEWGLRAYTRWTANKRRQEEGENGERSPRRDKGDNEADYIECDLLTHLGGRMWVISTKREVLGETSWKWWNSPGTFTLLAYTNDSPDVAIPATWDDADPHLIDRGKVEQVRLRSFSTNVHSLEVSCALFWRARYWSSKAMVAYRVGE